MSNHKTRTMLATADNEHGHVERENGLERLWDPIELLIQPAEPQDYDQDRPPPSDPLSARFFEMAGVSDPNSLASKMFSGPHGANSTVC